MNNLLQFGDNMARRRASARPHFLSREIAERCACERAYFAETRSILDVGPTLPRGRATWRAFYATTLVRAKCSVDDALRLASARMV